MSRSKARAGKSKNRTRQSKNTLKAVQQRQTAKDMKKFAEAAAAQDAKIKSTEAMLNKLGVGKLITIVTAFSAVYVQFVASRVANFFIADPIAPSVISALLIIILGGLYSSTVMEPFGNKRVVDKKFILINLLVVVIFCFTSTLTGTFVVNTFGDANLQARNDALNNMTPATQIASLVVSVLLVPIAEEIAYRRFLYAELSRLNKMAALFISAIVFAITHGTLTHMWVAFLGGVLFAIIYDKTRNLGWNIAAHMLYNFLTVIFGMTPIPQAMLTAFPVIIFNIATVVCIIISFKTDTLTLEMPKSKIRTAEQIKRDEETRRIVEDVMNEYKQKRK